MRLHRHAVSRKLPDGRSVWVAVQLHPVPAVSVPPLPGQHAEVLPARPQPGWLLRGQGAQKRRDGDGDVNRGRDRDERG